MRMTGFIPANPPDLTIQGQAPAPRGQIDESEDAQVIPPLSRPALTTLFTTPFTTLLSITLLVFMGAITPVFGAQDADAPPTTAAGSSPAGIQQTQIWEDGTKYIGTITDGKREGKGTIIWPDGTRFTGHFKNDLRDGPGTMVLPDGTIYNGNFENGELVTAADRQPESGAPIANVSKDDVAANTKNQPQQLFPPVTEISKLVKEDLRKILNLWAAAWSEQNVEQYLANYADEFKVPGKLSRRQWEILRRSRITRPATIFITLEFDDMAIIDTNIAKVELTQDYQSDLYSDITRKTMILQRDHLGSWLIIAEDIID